MPPHDETSAILPVRSQPILAACVVLGLACLGGWFIRGGGLSGGLVDYDQPPPATKVFMVDINHASVIELSPLPGLGEITAQKIVEHRETKGRFASHDDLLDVPGIGPSTLEAMRPHLRPIPDRKEAP